MATVLGYFQGNDFFSIGESAVLSKSCFAFAKNMYEMDHNLIAPEKCYPFQNFYVIRRPYII